MPTPDADPTASLEAIKERAKSAAAMDIDVLAAFNGVSVGGVIAASAVDVPRLVAALEAVLKLADDWDAATARTTAQLAELGMPAAVKVMGSGDTGNPRSAELREAITRALTGDADA